MYQEDCHYGNKTVCATQYESVCSPEQDKPPGYKSPECRQVPREKCAEETEKICKKVPEQKCEGNSQSNISLKHKNPD